jgi:hypothetical protein
MLDPSIVGQRDLPWMGCRPADVAELWVFLTKLDFLSIGLNLGLPSFQFLEPPARGFLMCL